MKFLKYFGISLGALVLILLFIGFFFLDNMGFIAITDDSLKPVSAPNINEKIQGYWCSEGPNAYKDLNDADEMKRVGINTITFSPSLSHDQEGNVTELRNSEIYVKKTINKAHRAGIRVMLETTPMNMAAVNPKVKNVKLFQDQMTKYALKYADIAEKYNVEFFAPIVEPVHHMSAQEADEWLHELLPKIKEVYKGPVMWKKQSNDLSEPKVWDVDHIFDLDFVTNSTEVRLSIKAVPDSSINFAHNDQSATLSKYSGKDRKFEEFKSHQLKQGEHNLQIKIEGNLIKVDMDGENLFEKTDETGPMGGYVIHSDIQIKNLKVSDLSGKVLYQEKFQNLNSWSWIGDKEPQLENDKIMTPFGSEMKLIHDTDFSGYDYIAIDTFHRGKSTTIDQYVDNFAYVIKKTNEQAAADGVPNVIIAEFGGSLKKNLGWKDTDAREAIPLTEEELAETVQKVLELAENTVDGYIYNGWNVDKQGINKLPAVKRVVSNWYNSH